MAAVWRTLLNTMSVILSSQGWSRHESALLLQVAMAHAPADEAPLPDGYSVSDEFFVYKFSKEQAGLSGLAFDEGVFSVFGYVTEVSTSCCHTSVNAKAFSPGNSPRCMGAWLSLKLV